MTATERARRNSEIVQARILGLGWAQITGTYGLTERMCQKVVADYRKSRPSLSERDPIELVEQMIEQYEGAGEELVG